MSCNCKPRTENVAIFSDNNWAHIAIIIVVLLIFLFS